MKKLDKILAIASAVMLISCVGGVSPRAVKCNEKGIPYALELPENPTEAQVFEELQLVENSVNEMIDNCTPEELDNNTLQCYSEIYYRYKGCYEELAKYIASQYIFKSNDIMFEHCSEAAISYSDLNKRFFQCVLEGKGGYCTLWAGYFYNLLEKAQIECYSVNVYSAGNYTSHDFIVYKPTVNSENWYVLPCGFKPTMKDHTTFPLYKLTIEYYLALIKTAYKADMFDLSISIQPPKVGQETLSVNLSEHLKTHEIDLFSKASALIDDLILYSQQMFKLKYNTNQTITTLIDNSFDSFFNLCATTP